MHTKPWLLLFMIEAALPSNARADLKVFPPCYRGNATHLLHNQPNVFWIHATGPEVANQNKVTIQVEMDKLIELYSFPETQLEKKVSDAIITYTFTGNPAAVPGFVTIAHQAPGTAGKIKVSILDQEKKIFQQTVSYTILPELALDVVPPKDFQLFYWSIADWRQTGKWMPNEIQKKMIDIMVKGLGYEYLTMYWGGDPTFGRLAKQRGVKLILAQMSPFQGTGVKDSDFPSEAAGTTLQGARVIPTMQWAITHPEVLDKYGFGVYKGLVKQDYCDGVNDDYEPGGCNYNSVDGLTLTAFSQWSGIPQQDLTQENLHQRYFADWTNFKVWQNTEYIRLYADAMRRVKPNVKVYICAQPLPPAGDETNFLAVQGVDPRYLDPYIDAHVPMMYMDNKVFYHEVERTAKGLLKPVIPLAQLSYGAEADNVVRSPDDVVMGFYSALTGGCAGYSFYDGTFAWGDGEYFHKLAAAWKQVQPLEQVFTRGCRAEDEVKVEVLPSSVTTYVDAGGKKQTISKAQADDAISWRAHRKGERLVVSLFNFGAEAKFLKIAPHRSWPVAYSVQGGRRLPLENSAVIVKVASTSVAQTLFTLIDDPLVRNKSLSDSDRVAYEKFITKRELPARRSGDAAIFDVLTPEQQAAVVLSIPGTRLTVVPDNGGRVVSWTVGNKETAGFAKMERYAGGLGVDLFWYPATAGWQANEYGALYQIESDKIVSGVPQITLSRLLSKSELKGLLISKTYRLAGKDTLDIEHAFRNTTDHPLTFSYWGHHTPQIPSVPDAKLPHRSQFRPVWPGTTGEQNANLDEKEVGEVFPVKDAPFTPGRESWEKNARQQVITDSWFALESRTSPERVTLKVEQDKLLQFYSAYEAVPPTLEWMSRVVTLKPGELCTVREEIKVTREKE